MNLRLMVAAMTAFALVGCATPQAPLYQWGGFPSYTYDALRGEGKSPQEQVDLMLAHSQKVAQAGHKLPPGFQAHLGLLMLKLGRPAAAQIHFEAERQSFPESAAYIDALAKASAKTKS
ncbi:MAG: DUF4810 domain-containing protein [Betaproteobacteria bacterium]